MSSSPSYFDVTYQAMDLELLPPGFWNETSVRLRLDQYTPAVMMILSAAAYYFYLVPFGFPALRPTSSSAVRLTKMYRDVHNMALFLYSGFVFMATFYYLYANHELTDWDALVCNPVEGTWLRALSTTFTLSKVWEWVDTAFILWLGRSSPKFLHKYHHATTFWLFWFVMNLPGPEKLGMLLNGFVHTLMYSHYWRPWPKALVPLITVLQILQLAFVTYVFSITPSKCRDSMPTEHGWDVTASFITPYLFVPVYLYLFCVFFVKRFLGKTKKKKAL